MVDECLEPVVSVPNLAARARIAPSALCAYFPSINAMFAELYLNRVSELPLVVDPAASVQSRLNVQLRAIALVLADEPRLALACSQAILRIDDPAVAAIQARIAAEVRRRLAAALGTGAWPEVLTTVETMFWGALMQVQSGTVGHHAMASRLDTMVSLLLPEVEH